MKKKTIATAAISMAAGAGLGMMLIDELRPKQDIEEVEEDDNYEEEK